MWCKGKRLKQCDICFNINSSVKIKEIYICELFN